jgi:hypothetical protein
VAPHEVFCRSASQIEDRARERTLTCSSTPHPTRVALPYTHTIRSLIHIIHSPTQPGSPTTQHPRHSPNIHASVTLLTHPTTPAPRRMARTRRTRPRASLSSSKQRVLTTKRRLERRKSAPCSCWLRFSLVGGLQKHHCSRYRVHAFYFPLSLSLSCPLLFPSSPVSFSSFPLWRSLQVLFTHRKHSAHHTDTYTTTCTCALVRWRDTPQSTSTTASETIRC